MKKVWILFLSIFLFFGCDFMLFNESLDFSFENYTASDIEITARHIMRTKKKMIEMLSKNTGQTIKKVEKDVDRDYFMSAEEALEYGIIDKIITREK